MMFDSVSVCQFLCSMARVMACLTTLSTIFQLPSNIDSIIERRTRINWSKQPNYIASLTNLITKIRMDMCGNRIGGAMVSLRLECGRS